MVNVVRNDFIIACVDLLFFVPATFVSAACDATIKYMSCDHSTIMT
jgi:hypothetical protein